MKINKTIGALVIALSAASVAEAQQTIYVTGSTAFRAQVYAGLTDMGLTAQAGATSGNNNFDFVGTVSNSKIGTITNGSSGQSVAVICAFTGSTEGLNAIINGVSPVYTNTSGAAFSYPNGADISFCDVQESTTVYAGDPVNELSSVDGLNSSFGAGVAIVPFTWAASADANGKINNLTPYIVNDIFVNGFETLNFFDGVAADSAVNVYLTGRTNDSGTRITAQVDVGFDPQQPVIQYSVGGTLGTPPATGTWQNVGNNGYASGGNVAKALSVANSGDAISYVAWSDAASLKNGALPINYEGVSPFVGSPWTANSTPWNFAGMENGSYTFWSYEHLYESTKVSGVSFINANFGPDLINALEYEIANPAAGTIPSADLIKNMNVHRNADGTDVLAGN
ncbi:MAG TPA: hypothetical protein VGO67_18675 [Verrucomicrobiae bacterium]